MKKLVIISLPFIALLACKKDAQPSLISATVNNQGINFNVSAVAVTSALVNDKDKSIFIYGYNNSNDSEQIAILIADSIVLSAGTTYTSVPSNLYYNVKLFYQTANNTRYASAGPLPVGPHLDATAIITSLTANRITGTFSGFVKDTGANNITTLKITNGKFDVPLTYSGNPALPWK